MSGDVAWKDTQPNNGGGIEGRRCTPRSDLVTWRRPSEAWDKLMSIVLLFLSESKSKSNYKIQW